MNDIAILYGVAEEPRGDTEGAESSLQPNKTAEHMLSLEADALDGVRRRITITRRFEGELVHPSPYVPEETCWNRLTKTWYDEDSDMKIG